MNLVVVVFVFSNINIASWARNIESPVVLVDGIFLVDIELKELVMSDAFVIFISTSVSFA